MPCHQTFNCEQLKKMYTYLNGALYNFILWKCNGRRRKVTKKRKQRGNKKEGKGEQLNGKEKGRGNINNLRRREKEIGKKEKRIRLENKKERKEKKWKKGGQRKDETLKPMYCLLQFHQHAFSGEFELLWDWGRKSKTNKSQ